MKMMWNSDLELDWIKSVEQGFRTELFNSPEVCSKTVHLVYTRPRTKYSTSRTVDDVHLSVFLPSSSEIRINHTILKPAHFSRSFHSFPRRIIEHSYVFVVENGCLQ